MWRDSRLCFRFGSGLVFVLVSLVSGTASAQVQTFSNDFDAWFDAAGDFVSIGFEKDPDGEPSVPGTPLSDEFNYTAQGVTFFSNAPLEFVQSIFLGSALSARSLSEDVFIVAVFSEPVSAMGVSFPAGAGVFLFSAVGELLTSQSVNAPSSLSEFLGFVSDEPIAFAAFSRNVRVDTIRAIHFTAPSVCSSLVVSVDGLRGMVERLDTSQETVGWLETTLVRIELSLEGGRNKLARSLVRRFIRALILRSNLRQDRPEHISLAAANDLVCAASNVLNGIELEQE